MNKQALDTVNESFEKVAGIGNMLDNYVDTVTGAKFKNIQKRVGTLTQNFKQQSKIKNSLENSVRRIGADLRGEIKNSNGIIDKTVLGYNKMRKTNYNSLMDSNRRYNDTKKQLESLVDQGFKANRDMKLARIGTAVAVPAMTAGAFKLNKVMKKKREEKNNINSMNDINKQAFDAVNETFEKVAGIKDMANKYVDTLKGRKAIELTKELNNKKQDIAKLKAGLGAEGQKLYESSHKLLKKIPGDSFTKELRDMSYNHVLDTSRSINKENAVIKGLESQIGKAKLNSKIARGVTLAAGTAALAGAGAYGLNKLKKKKEEKTAFDIVDNAFEKITR